MAFLDRIFPRPAHQVILASGIEVAVDDNTAVQSILKRRKEWQIQSFDAYDACGELHYVCADSETQALSRQGWKSYDQLRVGDEIMALDHETGISTWKPIQDIHVYEDIEDEVLSVEGRFHSSLTTLNHRWPVLKTVRRNDEQIKTREWTDSAHLVSQHRMILAAPHADLPTEPKWSDEFVELVAWFWTEGSIEQNPGQQSQRVRISQSWKVNESSVASIERCLTAVFGPGKESLRSGAKRGDAGWRKEIEPRGIVQFFLNTNASVEFLEIAPRKVVSLDFIQQLTRAQLELFIQISLAADGHRGVITQRKEERIFPFEFACILAGYSVNSTKLGDGMFRCNSRRKATYWCHAGNRKRVQFQGTVWCPTVETSAWLARRKGSVYFTGNCGLVSDLISRLPIYVAEVPEDRSALPKRTDNTDAQSAIDRLGTPVEQADILRAYALNILLVGEANLICLQPGPGRTNTVEKWVVASIEDLVSGTPPRIMNCQYEEPAVSATGIRLDVSGDTWLRLWRPHPRKHMDPDSHVRAILEDIDELLWWKSVSRSAAKSRLNTVGMLTFPSNLELPAESEEDSRLSGTQRLMNKLQKSFMQTITNPGSGGGSIPSMISYPANDRGDSGIKQITIDRPQDDLLEKRILDCQKAIAQGLPVNPERVFGLSEASGWNGGTITESDFREHLEPFMLMLLSGLTSVFLHPILEGDKITDPNKYLIWYSDSKLVIHPDQTTQSNRGVEFGAVNLATWRRINGYDETAKPTDKELEELALWFMETKRGGVRNSQGQVNGPASQNDPNDPLAPPPPTQPATPGGHAPEPVVAPNMRGKGQPLTASANGNGNGHSSLGRKLAEIDADVFSRIQVMADASMRRAQERAGFQLRSKANKNPTLKKTLNNIPVEDVARTLGRETVIKLGMDDLFTEAFSDVPHLFSKWCDTAVTASFRAANIDPSTMKDAVFQLSYSTDDAGKKLVRELKELAAMLLFDRAAQTIAVPEGDDLLVPASLIRRALAYAGGSDKPNLLLATGHAVAKALAEHGLFATEYIWWYGPDNRTPNLVHQHLDGTTFDIQSSALMPGDGQSCRCLAVPQFQS